MKKNIILSVLLANFIFLSACQSIIDWSDRVGESMPTYDKMMQRRAVNPEYQPQSGAPSYPAPNVQGMQPGYPEATQGITTYPGMPAEPQIQRQGSGQSVNQGFPRAPQQQIQAPQYNAPQQNVPMNQYGR